MEPQRRRTKESNKLVKNDKANRNLIGYPKPLMLADGVEHRILT